MSSSLPVTAPRARVADDGRLDRSITLVLPGSIAFDGAEYRAFRPYAVLANALCVHFRTVMVSTQVVRPGHESFDGCDSPFSPQVVIDALPELPADDARGLGYQIRRAMAVVRRIRSWDLVYAFIPSYPGAIAFTLGRLVFRKPVAVYLANDWEEIAPYTFRGTGWRRRLFPLYRRAVTGWERWIMRSTPLGITAGRALMEKYGGPGRAIYETVPVLEMGPEQMVRRDPVALGSPVRALYVGSLISRKGLPVLVQALAQLVEQGRDIALDVVGDGPDLPSLEALVAELGLDDRVTFHGFVPNGPALYRFYRAAELFVLPTYSEGFPRVLYEALGHSVPVVASAVSGIPKLLGDGEHALLVPPGDPGALGRAIGRVIDDHELRRRIVSQGFDLVQPIIAADPARQFVELYQRHLAPGSPS